MPSPDEFRAAALALPEVEERSHMDHPDFRAGNRIFATLSEDETQGVLKLTLDEQAALLASAPDVYGTPGGWGRHGWTTVQLAVADIDEVRELLEDAWRQVAPKRVVKQFDTDHGPE